MELANFTKLAALTILLALLAGCSSTRSGDTSTATHETEGGADGSGLDGQSYGQNGNGSIYGAGDGSGLYGQDGAGADEEAALRAITTFYFEYDSSELRPDAMRSLDVHARDLKASGARVVLEGHTDERGTREYNMALGERRARAVQRYLMMQGVAASQLELVSWGEERPAVFGSDEYSWAQNRRVELRGQ